MDIKWFLPKAVTKKFQQRFVLTGQSQTVNYLKEKQQTSTLTMTKSLLSSFIFSDAANLGLKAEKCIYIYIVILKKLCQI